MLTKYLSWGFCYPPEQGTGGGRQQTVVYFMLSWDSPWNQEASLQQTELWVLYHTLHITGEPIRDLQSEHIHCTSQTQQAQSGCERRFFYLWTHRLQYMLFGPALLKTKDAGILTAIQEYIKTKTVNWHKDNSKHTHSCINIWSLTFQ